MNPSCAPQPLTRLEELFARAESLVRRGDQILEVEWNEGTAIIKRGLNRYAKQEKYKPVPAWENFKGEVIKIASLMFLGRGVPDFMSNHSIHPLLLIDALKDEPDILEALLILRVHAPDLCLGRFYTKGPSRMVLWPVALAHRLIGGSNTDYQAFFKLAGKFGQAGLGVPPEIVEFCKSTVRTRCHEMDNNVEGVTKFLTHLKTLPPKLRESFRACISADDIAALVFNGMNSYGTREEFTTLSYHVSGDAKLEKGFRRGLEIILERRSTPYFSQADRDKRAGELGEILHGTRGARMLRDVQKKLVRDARHESHRPPKVRTKSRSDKKAER